MAGVLSPKEYAAGLKLFCKISSKLGEGWNLQSTGQEDELLYMRSNVVKSINFVKREFRSGDTASCENALDATSFCDVMNAEDDDSSVIPEITSGQSDESSSKEVCTFEYHVVYSTSYQVPVLYVNVNKQNGALLSLEEIWQQVPAYYQQRLEQERWTFITQQEHPLLGRPFYQLHPCHTSKLMTCVQTITKDNQCSISNVAGAASKSDPMCVTYEQLRKDIADTDSTGIDKEEGIVAFKYLVSWLSSVGPVVLLELPLQFANLEFRLDDQ